MKTITKVTYGDGSTKYLTDAEWKIVGKDIKKMKNVTIKKVSAFWHKTGKIFKLLLRITFLLFIATICLSGLWIYFELFIKICVTILISIFIFGYVKMLFKKN